MTTLATAQARVAEFLRQWALMRDKTDIIYGVHSDPDGGMADLFASDVRVLLEATQ